MINEQFDKLTGLYTQKYFERRFEEEVSRTNRYKRPLTLMILEINYDYFKTDANVRWAMIYTILKQFGALLRKQLRNVDIGGRYSGETFVIVFPETNLEGGKIAAERIRKAVERHEFIGDTLEKDIKIAVNVGLATFPQHGIEPKELLSSAQQALLISRNQGGNMVMVSPNELYNLEGEPLIFIDSREKQNPGQSSGEPETEEAVSGAEE